MLAHRSALLFSTLLGAALLLGACGGRVDGIPLPSGSDPNGSGTAASASGTTSSPPGTACREIPTCDEGDTKVASESACPQDDAACYSRTRCDQVIWCSKDALCDGLPVCPDGSQVVKQCSANMDCIDVTVCGSTIQCMKSCEGPQPICDAGDTQVASPSQCLQDDAVCYSRTTCGHAIWCTGPSK